MDYSVTSCCVHDIIGLRVRCHMIPRIVGLLGELVTRREMVSWCKLLSWVCVH